MTVRRRSRIWTQQPQVAVGLSDQARQAGFTHLFNFGEGTPGLHGLGAPVNASMVDDVSGRAVKFSGALADGIPVTGNPFNTSSGTWLWVESGVDVTSSGQSILNTRYALTPAPEAHGLQIRVKGTSIWVVEAGTALHVDAAGMRNNDGRLNCCAFSYAGNSSRHTLFSAGRLVSDTTPTTAYAHDLSAIGGGSDCPPVTLQFYVLAFAPKVLSDSVLKQFTNTPWQIFTPQARRRLISAGGGSVNANASGAFSTVSVTAPTVSASGSASASGSLAAITLSAPTATASAGGSANASGSFAAISISPATATATATTSATASGAFAVVSLSAPTATATGTTAGGANATCTPAQITISHAAAIAIGSAVASGGYQSIGITAPTGSASVGNGNATASGTWAAISITAPAAYASSGFVRAPSGSGPTVIQPGSYRPSNTGGRRY